MVGLVPSSGKRLPRVSSRFLEELTGSEYGRTRAQEIKSGGLVLR